MGDVLKPDVRTNTVIAHWAMPGCANPHGLALDKANGRLLMGCINNVMKVVDTRDGHVIATLPIGAGSDAIAFDAKRKRVFSSNGRDGAISVIQQTAADRYTAMAPS
jgi:DNA-binding beta-propeller fold protein YncE